MEWLWLSRWWCLNWLNFQTKWPEQSEELLGLIVNSLRALEGAVPQGCPEPRRRPQSASKISLVLDRAPKNLQPELVALVPKLVEQSEHPLAAFALLERLQKPEAEPSLRTPVRSWFAMFSFVYLFAFKMQNNPFLDWFFIPNWRIPALRLDASWLNFFLSCVST